LIASDIELGGWDHIREKAGCNELGVQAFGGRRCWIRFEGQQVGYGGGGSGKLEIGSVDDFLSEQWAAGDVNGLGAVMGFVASGAGSCAGLGSAEVFDARKLVAGIVDDFVGLQMGRGIGAKAVDFAGNQDDGEEQECFEKPSGD
jgi:hypothetical protein